MDMFLASIAQILISLCATMIFIYFTFVVYREILRVKKDITKIKNK